MRTWMIVAALAASAPLAPATATPVVAPQAATRHIHVAAHGTAGPLLVLIPGMSTPGAVWDETVAAFKNDHRLLVVEVAGFGGGRAPANEQDGLIEAIVDDIAGELGRRDLGPATLVGHSFGGLVAMRFALKHPTLAKRLVIVDALPFFGTVFDEKATVETVRPRAVAMRDMMQKQQDAIRAMAARPVSRDPGGDMSIRPDTRIRIANWSMRADPAVVGQALLEDLAMDLRTDIAAIKAPMTVLYQARSPVLAAARYGTDYAANAGAVLVPIADSGHFIMLDQPERFRAELKAAMDR